MFYKESKVKFTKDVWKNRKIKGYDGEILIGEVSGKELQYLMKEYERRWK